jgi:quercetin dioxygenase-like cupin family protein
MEIKRSGSQPSGKGPADYFTGSVRIDPLFQAPDPARVVGASVTFEPGARTAWHTHPLGQTLIVMAGCGWAQREGGPIEEIRPGDVVSFPPGDALKDYAEARACTTLFFLAARPWADRSDSFPPPANKLLFFGDRFLHLHDLRLGHCNLILQSFHCGLDLWKQVLGHSVSSPVWVV